MNPSPMMRMAIAFILLAVCADAAEQRHTKLVLDWVYSEKGSSASRLEAMREAMKETGVSEVYVTAFKDGNFIYDVRQEASEIDQAFSERLFEIEEGASGGWLYSSAERLY